MAPPPIDAAAGSFAPAPSVAVGQPITAEVLRQAEDELTTRKILRAHGKGTDDDVLLASARLSALNQEAAQLCYPGAPAAGVGLLQQQLNQILDGQHQLMQKTDQLTAKTDQLTAKTDQLTAKTDQLTAKTDQLTAKTDQLTAKTDQLSVDMNATKEQLKRLTDEVSWELRNINARRVNSAATQTYSQLQPLVTPTGNMVQGFPTTRREFIDLTENQAAALLAAFQLLPIPGESHIRQLADFCGVFGI